MATSTSTSTSILDFINRPDPSVSNYQKAIAQFRRRPELIPIGAYLAAMEIIADDGVGTACTDCVSKIIYSPKYFESLTVDECVSALLHEAMHKFNNFFPRAEAWMARQDPKWSRRELLQVYNVAADYAINWGIKHSWHLPLGAGWLYDPKYDLNVSTNKIADELLAKKDKAGGSGGSSAAGKPAPEGEDEGSASGNSEDSSGGDGPSTQPDDGSEDNSKGDDATGGDGEGDGVAKQGEDAEDQSKPGGSSSSEESDTEDTDSDQSAGGKGDDPSDQPDYNPEDPTDSELGAGDDIMLPEQYENNIDKPLEESQLRELEMNNRQDISDALRAAKGLSKALSNRDPFSQNAHDAAYTPGFNFRAELMRHANQAVRSGKYTWARPNRRMKTAAGLPMPGRRSKQLGTVVHIIDSSGSTDGPMVRYFLDEVKSAMRTLDYEKVVVIWCSDAVAKVFEFTKAEINKDARLFDGVIYRRGFGTNFPPAFEHVAEHYRDAKVITYLTDGGVGEYDVFQSKEIMVKAGMIGVPVLWALACDCDYEYVQRFIDWTKEYNFGRCARLPMDEIRGGEHN